MRPRGICDDESTARQNPTAATTCWIACERSSGERASLSRRRHTSVHSSVSQSVHAFIHAFVPPAAFVCESNERHTLACVAVIGKTIACTHKCARVRTGSKRVAKFSIELQTKQQHRQLLVIICNTRHPSPPPPHIRRPPPPAAHAKASVHAIATAADLLCLC